MDQWWIDTERGNPQYQKKNVFQCHFDEHKSHNSGIISRSPRWDTCNQSALYLNIQFVPPRERRDSTRRTIQVILSKAIIAVICKHVQCVGKMWFRNIKSGGLCADLQALIGQEKKVRFILPLRVIHFIVQTSGFQSVPREFQGIRDLFLGGSVDIFL